MHRSSVCLWSVLKLKKQKPKKKTARHTKAALNKHAKTTVRWGFIFTATRVHLNFTVQKKQATVFGFHR